MKFLISAIFLALVASSSGQTISCVYSLLPGVPYTCTLSINNPNGNNFLSIPGAHSSGKTNADVLKVVNANGNTLNIPEVICRQFQNLQELQFDNSRIQNLSAANFGSCANLKSLIVVKNSISQLPADLFSGAPSLEIVHLYENGIQTISSGIFSGLSNLKTLGLNGNLQIQLPADIFQTLSKLEILNIFWCGFTALEPQWFAGLTSLRVLRFQDNAIEELPDGIFANLPNLLEVNAQRNKLSVIKAASFPSMMSNLNRVLFHQNQISAIDPIFFDLSPNLFAAYFTDNICVNSNVTQFNANREASLAYFIDCFDAFNPPGGKCRLFTDPTYGYTCELIDVTFKSAQRTFTIETDHGNDPFTDDDVTGLIFTTSHLEKIPPQVFETFQNLQFLQARQSGLSEVIKGSFEGCVQSLKFIDASHNCIREIGGDAFVECERVEDIRLNHNCIYSIQPCKSFFVNRLGNLTDLNLKHNVCVDETYQTINLAVKEDMKLDMRGCFGMWYD